eukprot:COSAG06_NODE_53458_length_300_cov_0.512438_1_plen_37_part_10
MVVKVDRYVDAERRADLPTRLTARSAPPSQSSLRLRL